MMRYEDMRPTTGLHLASNIIVFVTSLSNTIGSIDAKHLLWLRENCYRASSRKDFTHGRVIYELEVLDDNRALSIYLLTYLLVHES